MGKFLVIVILASASVAGVGLYYLQVYHFYQEVTPTGDKDVQMTSRSSGVPEPLPHEGFEAIDAESSPIRYRACFTTRISLATLTETFAGYEGAVPLEAPGWFECFDADAIGAGLESGRALAFLGQQDIRYGIDWIVAVFDDGRGFAWHQINRCGEVVFDGEPVPEGCPALPE